MVGRKEVVGGRAVTGRGRRVALEMYARGRLRSSVVGAPYGGAGLGGGELWWWGR